MVCISESCSSSRLSLRLLLKIAPETVATTPFRGAAAVVAAMTMTMTMTMALGFSAGAYAAGAERPPVPVIAERATMQTIADTLEALGTLRAKESVQITAMVADTISDVRFEDGQLVEAGDILVEQTDTEEAALLREAESMAKEAKRQYERIKSLAAKSSASESLLDERRQTWQTAQAREEAVRSRLQDRLIEAPFSGHVGLRLMSPGALVSPGDIITTLVDDTSMKLDFTIPAVYLDTVRVGTTIEATTPVYAGRTFVGTVNSVDSTINPSTRSITVRALIPNEQRILVSGMLMTLNLKRNPREAIMVSEEAIVPLSNKTFVMVVDESAKPNVVSKREVTIGRRVAGKVEITKGLAVAETIVSHGTLKLRPGSAVTIKAVNDGSKTIAEMISNGEMSDG